MPEVAAMAGIEQVDGIGQYTQLGTTLDDARGEFKTPAGAPCTSLMPLVW